MKTKMNIVLLVLGLSMTSVLSKHYLIETKDKTSGPAKHPLNQTKKKTENGKGAHHQHQLPNLPDDDDLNKKLPDGFELHDKDRNKTWRLDGAIALHVLAGFDYDQLEKRKDQINSENVNSIFSLEFEDKEYKEVSQPPLPLPSSAGHSTVVLLLLSKVGRSALAPEQGRRSQQGGENVRSR